MAPDSTPPPMIGKIGPYTVFMTPPSTPKPAVEQPVFDSPKKIVVPPPPPVQPPPQQFDKSIQSSNDSVTGFFKNAVTKVQNEDLGWLGIGALLVEDPWVWPRERAQKRLERERENWEKEGTCGPSNGNKLVPT
uniref:Uncharacterized protein n=1 Tax=Fagus sylvatica TaxID=28930 RepID=A0A2N9GY84_FAGSY